MSTSKHTPGPWIASQGENLERTIIRGQRAQYIAKVDGNCSNVSTKEVREADAALIAAAPELLAALRRIVTLETADEDDDAFMAQAEDASERGLTSAQYRAELIEQARAAIAKATEV